MTPPSPPATHWSEARAFALADDLSGAAETAAVLAVPGYPATIRLGRNSRAVEAGLTVVDLHCRTVRPDEAAARTAAALAGTPADARLFVKIDSLLRGNVGACVGAVAARGPVVVVAALPGSGRTVRDGVVHLDGVPLHATAAWRIETRSAPRSVAAALAADCPIVGVAELRADPHTALTGALASSRVVVCDAENADDLDRIAAATVAADVAAAGSGEFAAALGRATGRRGLGTGPPPDGPPRPVLAVVGSAEPVAARQVARLLEDGAAEIPLRPGDPVPAALLAGPAPGPAGAQPPAVGVTVLRPDPDVRGDPSAVAEMLASAAAKLAAGPVGPHLVLTGGETARRVLDALGADVLEPVGQIAHGAIRSRTADGRHVVTRPGSFGDDDSLRAMTAALTTAHFETPHTGRNDRKAAI